MHTRCLFRKFLDTGKFHIGLDKTSIFDRKEKRTLDLFFFLLILLLYPISILSSKVIHNGSIHKYTELVMFTHYSPLRGWLPSVTLGHKDNQTRSTHSGEEPRDPEHPWHNSDFSYSNDGWFHHGHFPFVVSQSHLCSMNLMDEFENPVDGASESVVWLVTVMINGLDIKELQEISSLSDNGKLVATVPAQSTTLQSQSVAFQFPLKTPSMIRNCNMW